MQQNAILADRHGSLITSGQVNIATTVVHARLLITKYKAQIVQKFR